MPSKSDFTNFLTYFPYSSKEKLSIGLITKPSILSVLEILFFIVMIGFMLGVIFGQEEIISRKNLKSMGIAVITLIIIGIGILIFRNINTPDIVFLKGMMGR